MLQRGMSLFTDSWQLMLQAVLIVLLATSVATAAVTSAFISPYSSEHVKRVMLQHMLRMNASQHLETSFALASLDATPIERAVNMTQHQPAPSDGKEWMVSVSPCAQVLPLRLQRRTLLPILGNQHMLSLAMLSPALPCFCT